MSQFYWISDCTRIQLIQRTQYIPTYRTSYVEIPVRDAKCVTWDDNPSVVWFGVVCVCEHIVPLSYLGMYKRTKPINPVTTVLIGSNVDD